MPQLGGRSLSMLYGTAWKKDRSAHLVFQALQAGFRGVDTAAQPRHYQEHGVGQGIREAISSGNVTREDIYIQTKYTPISGQDPNNLPYDANASIPEQVNASVSSSLSHLRHSDDNTTSYLDCLVLHSPLPTLSQTLEAWTAMSAHVPSRVRTLGISNTTLPILQALHSQSAVKPAVVQNRFYADTAYDAGVRAFCAAHGIIYQSFWTLTANPALVRSQLVGEIAALVRISREVAVYGLVASLDGGNVCVVNGTTTHMLEDVEGLRKVDIWKAEDGNEVVWRRFTDAFVRLIERI
ncbi:hypothetical protein AAFC00_001361 [Neodothiora populina]|uniref:NADP-dependent oxidoreductase domain-containing protein n=1 Tax=Neodothiora populina TaxID=2781224 RepID=A0ABR3PNP5_9PEZI